MTVIFNNKLCVCPLSVLTSQILLLYLLNERGKLKLSVCAVSGFFLELLHWTSNQDDDRFPSCWRGCRMSVKETRYWADFTLQLMFLHLGTSMFRGLHIQHFGKPQIFLPPSPLFQSHFCQGHHSLLSPLNLPDTEN